MTPLVLLAGMNCTSDLWAECGLDQAVTPPLDRESIDAQVDWLLDRLPARFALGGLSLGAIVALALADRAPARVSRLCLVSTNAKAPTTAQQGSWNVWTERLKAGASARSLQADILTALLSPEALATRPELAERTLAMGDQTGTDHLLAQLAMQRTRVDLRPALQRVSVPTLVISGSGDMICPPEFHTEIVSHLSGGRQVTLDGGHLLPMERPEAFGALLRDWHAA